MAKKRETLPKRDSDERLELKTLDLDDLDDDFGLDEKPEGGPIRRFVGGFKKGMFDSIGDRSTVRRIVRSSMPDSYSRAEAELGAVAGNARGMVSDARRELGPELGELSQSLETGLPNLKSRTPARLYRKLEEGQQQFQAILDRDQPGPTPASPEDGIEGTLNDVFARQNAASEQNAATRFNVERTERAARARVSDAKFGVLNERLTQIASNSNAGRSYQEQVEYRYQRRSLELQYRSFFALRDIRRMAGENLRALNQGFESVVHNTGLPDHLKFQNAERLESGVRSTMASGIASKVAETLPDYIGSFWQKALGNIKEDATNGFRDTSAIGSVISQVMNAGNDKAGMAGQGIGAMAGGKAVDAAVPLLRRLIRPKMNELDEKNGGIGDWLTYQLTNAPALMQEYTQDIDDEGGIKGMLKSYARRVFPSFMPDDELKSGTFQTIDEGAGFNHLTQRSIVDIIPGYLSRILQEARMLRTGRDDIERETYDITSGSFTSHSGAKDALMKRVAPDSSSENVAYGLNAALDKYDPEGNLSENARDAMRERLLRDASRNGRFNPDDYIAGRDFSPETDDNTLNEISKHFSGQFDTDENGGVTRSGRNNRKMMDMSDDFMFIRNMLPQPEKQIRRVMESGSQELLREMGLVNVERGRETVNQGAIWEQYQNKARAADRPGQDKTAFDPKNLTDVQLRKLSGLPTPQLTEIIKHHPEVKDRLLVFDPRLKDSLKNAFGSPSVTREPMSKDTQRTLDMVANLGPGSEAEDGAPTSMAPPASGRSAGAGVSAARQVFNEVTDRQPTPGVMPGSGHAEDSAAPAALSLDTTNDWLEQIHAALTRQEDQWNQGVAVTQMPSIKMAMDKDGNPVIDNEGDGETQKGKKPGLGRRLLRKTGRGVKGYYKMLGKGMMMPFKGLKALKKSKADRETDNRSNKNKITDIYIKGQPKEPVLLARDIRNGRYYDNGSEKVISTADDITGEVLDLETMNIVLTQDEFERGLYNREGKSVLKKTLSGIGSFYKDFYYNPSKAVVKGVGKAVAGMFKPDYPRDVYVEGEKSPRLLGRLIRRGDFYFVEESGDAVSTYDDLTGTIVDKYGDVMVEEEELDLLVRRNGDPLEKGSKLGSIAKLPFKIAGGFGKLAMKGFKAQADMVTGIMSGIGKLFGGRGGRDKGFQGNVLEGMDAIYKLLDERLEPKGPRDNSWRDQFADEAAADEEAEDAEQRRSWLDKLKQRAGGAVGMAGMAAGGDDEDDGDIYAGSAGGDGEDKETRKEKKARKKAQKKNKKPVPKGFWAKTAHYGKKVGGGLLKGTGKVAMGALGFMGLGGAASAVGGAATSVAGGVAAVAGTLVSAPVIAGVLAVGATAAGIYGLYKAYKWITHDDVGELGKFRMLQYGVNPDNTDQVDKVLRLEAIYKGAVQGDGSIDRQKLEPKELVEAMDVNPRSQAACQQMADWLTARFEVVYIKHLMALKKIRPDTALKHVDDKLTDEEQRRYLKEVRLAGTEKEVYSARISPFEVNETLSVSRGQIENAYNSLLGDIEKTAEESSGAKDAAAVASGGFMGRTARQLKGGTQPSSSSSSKDTGVEETPTKEKGGSPRQVKSRGREAALYVNKVGSGSAYTAAVAKERDGIRQQREEEKKTGYAQTKWRSGHHKDAFKDIQSLMTVVFRACGFPNNDTDDAKSMKYLYAAAQDFIHVDGDLNARFEGTPQEVLNATGFQYLNPTDDERDQWNAWFKGRFLPACLAYAAAWARTVGKGSSQSQATKEQELQIAKAVMNAKSEYDGDPTDIWSFPVGPNGALKAEEMKHLQESAKFVVRNLKALADRAADTTASGGDIYGAIRPVDFNANPSPLQSTKEQANRDAAKSSSVLGKAKEKYNALTGRDTQQGGGRQSQAPFADAGRQGSRGNVYSATTQGNGGVWEEIRKPTSDGNFQGAFPTLKDAGEMVGVDPYLLATIADIESGFRARVKAPTSSATGWFQFISGTWDGMMDKYAGKYGIPQGASPKDPRINALLGAQFIKDNARYLENKLGEKPTDTDIYMAHFLGVGDVAKFMKANPAMPAARVLPKPAQSNRSIFYKNGRMRTVSEVYQLMDEKVSRHRFGGEDVRKTDKGNTKSKSSKDVSEMEGSGNAAVNADAANDLMAGIDEEDGANFPLTSGGRSNLRDLGNRGPGDGKTSTPAPLRAPDVGKSTPKPPSESSGNGSSGATEIEQHRERKRRQAEVVDRQRRETSDANMQANQSLTHYARKSLEVQQEMRDYLRTMAASHASGGGGEPAKDGPGEASPKATPGSQQKRSAGPGQPAPVSMKR